MREAHRIALPALIVALSTAAPFGASAQTTTSSASTAAQPLNQETGTQTNPPLTSETKPPEKKPENTAATQPAEKEQGGYKVVDTPAIKVNVNGYLQLDARFFFGDAAKRPIDTFFPRQIRPMIQGTAFKFISFRLMPDFGQGRVTLEDAYIDLAACDEFHVRFGKEKTTIGIERIQGDPAVWLIERSQVSNLVPNRDVGVSFQGKIGKGALEYVLGWVNGVPENASGDLSLDGKKNYVGRILIKPFRLASIDALSEVAFGIGGMHGVRRGTAANPQTPVYRTPAQQRLFNFLADPVAGTVVANGDADRWSPHMYAYVGPVGLMAEYVHSTQEVALKGDSAKITSDAFEITAAWVITGESPSFTGVKPKKPASWTDGGWGAWEVVVRYDSTQYSKAALGRFSDNRSFSGADAIWGGLNWYMNDAMKFSGVFVHSSFKDSQMPTLLDKEDAFLFQSQIVF